MHPSSQPDRSGCPWTWHGTAAAYSRGCRCPDAREARRLYAKRRRLGRPEVRRLPAVGTQRRIRALMVLGHNSEAIAALVGISSSNLLEIAGKRRYVTPLNYQRVSKAYDALSMTLGKSERTRRRAQRAGWAPPLAWEYQNIDDPAAKPAYGRMDRRLPSQPRVTHQERRDAVYRRWSEGATDRHIADELRTTVEAVRRMRQRHGWTRPERGGRPARVAA
jgi:hypothetical protein